MEVEDLKEPVAVANDELREQFERLEVSPKTIQQKLSDFEALLQNPRVDDEAIKVKEQCIYR